MFQLLLYTRSDFSGYQILVLQLKKCDVNLKKRFILSSVLIFIAITLRLCIIASVSQNEIANINSFRFVSNFCLKVLKATADADIATVCKNCMKHHKTIKAKLKRKENRLVKVQNIPVTKYAPISKVSRERLKITFQVHQRRYDRCYHA